MSTSLLYALLSIGSPLPGTDPHFVPPLPLHGLAAYGNTTCAIDDDEVFRCWGEAAPDRWIPRRAARRILVREGVRCLITTDDQLICRWATEALLAVDRAFGAVKDAALLPDRGVCFIDKSGALTCSGPPSDGGESRDEASEGPLLTGADALAVHGRPGSDLTCAVLTNGDLTCRRKSCSNSWTTILRDVVEVEGNRHDGHMCARTNAGDVLCWMPPDDLCRAVGDEPIAPIAGLTHDVVDIALGLGLGCALHTDGGVSCWSMTRGTPEFMGARRNQSVQNARELAVGDHHACIRDPMNAIACWGARDANQFGDRLDDRELDEPTPVPGMDDAVRLVGNDVETCAVLADARVACWGRRWSRSAVPMWNGNPELRDELGRVRDIVRVGPAGMCALRETGEAVCWGEHADGIAPDEPITNIAGSSGSRVKALCYERRGDASACRGEYSYKGEFRPFQLRIGPLASKQVVMVDSDLYRLGPSGVLLVESTEWNHRARRVERFGTTEHALPPGSTIAAGDDLPCVLDGLGSVTCFPGVGERVLGRPLARPYPRPALFVVGQSAEQLAVGAGHACVRHVGGRVSCWGDNRHFQLGQATETELSVDPLIVPGIDDAMFIGAWSDRTCVVHGGGHVSCWGANTMGAAGAGDGMPADNPVQCLGAAGLPINRPGQALGG